MKIAFNFGGFYDSDYSEFIENIVYDENEEIVEQIDFKTLHNEAAKVILKSFSEQINNEFDVDVKFEFVEIDSPKYYNFSTDKIILKLTKINRIKLDLLLANNHDDINEMLLDEITHITTSRPGYIPFYKYDEVVAKINKDNKDVYYECLLNALYCKDTTFNLSVGKLNDVVYSNM